MMEGTVAVVGEVGLILFAIGAIGWLWKLDARSVALAKRNVALEKQVDGLRRMLRMLATGTAEDCVQKGTQIAIDEQAVHSHREIVTRHSEAYVRAMATQKWPPLVAFIEKYPVLRLGKCEYKFWIIETRLGQDTDFRGVYYTPQGPGDYPTKCEFVVVQSSRKAENAGDADWPYLKSEAHDLLCETLQVLYGREGEG